MKTPSDSNDLYKPAPAGPSRRAIKTNYMSKYVTINPQDNYPEKPTLREATEAVSAYVNSLRTENGYPLNSPEAEGDKWGYLSAKAIGKLMVACRVCYSAAQHAESKSRTNLIVGLVGGATITAGTFGIFSLARRRRNQRRNGGK